MDDFNDLLLKLQECHEREIEGWQVKLQELANKKGCDTKRMEELYTRNQQMKEQQRILTENIKTLENRLRAGLCDRCTVTQEVAKKRQQEIETLHLQSVQHIRLMVSDINNLKKENKMLRDENRSLRTALDQTGHSSSDPVEVKTSSSPDRSLPMALISRVLGRSSSQTGEGDATVKVEAPTRLDTDSQSESRHVREWPRSLFESYKPLPNSAPPSWKPQPRVVDRRSHSEDHTHSSSPPGKSLPPSSLSSSLSSVSLTSLSPIAEVHAPSRHILHAPVPCRPQPLKSTSNPLPSWSPLGEPPDWATATASSQCSKPRFPNLIPSTQHLNSHASRRLAAGQVWHKPNVALQNQSKEPTVVFRLRSREQERGGGPREPQEPQGPKGPQGPQGPQGSKLPQGQRESHLIQSEEGSSHEGSECEGPLDLSDTGRTKAVPRDSSPPGGTVQADAAGGAVQSGDETCAEPQSAPEATTTMSVKERTEERPEERAEESSDTKNNKVVKQKEQVNGKEEQGKKVPVLTISLRPVVVLESLNSAAQKHDSSSSNQNSPDEAGGGSSSDEREEDSGDSVCGNKRKRDESDSDESVSPQRKVMITVRSEKKR
ncbi:hypothetical protein NQD34_005093 [Periophthalmus magnuspinnatus]|nr:hypothetical protein NQD34_005093 [Periophthalmus magnuspinnatus]